MTPDISSVLGSAPPGTDASSNPLTQPDYPAPADSEAEESAPGDAADDAAEVDPEFKSLAAELFPDWPDEDFAKFQQLIDSRLNAAPPAPGPGGF